ncbi:hypothetical protein [Trichloromonas sp.]|uniref:hypothetical protein n=1 Tax=Trichloromonas sp. TaxID=3069249 RepID=UPI002A404F8E|nr:hypothetical protein [Trichloromonas sp.]
MGVDHLNDGHGTHQEKNDLAVTERGFGKMLANQIGRALLFSSICGNSPGAETVAIVRALSTERHPSSKSGVPVALSYPPTNSRIVSRATKANSKGLMGKTDRSRKRIVFSIIETSFQQRRKKKRLVSSSFPGILSSLFRKYLSNRRKNEGNDVLNTSIRLNAKSHPVLGWLLASF